MVVHLVGAVLRAVAGQTEGLVRRELVDAGVDTSSDSDAESVWVSWGRIGWDVDVGGPSGSGRFGIGGRY